MPITLVTGLPGHGKTLYALSRWKDEAEREGRPVFHNGIPGLNIPGWQVFAPKDWETLPANSLIIIDECQKAFPIRGRGEPPPFINNLSTHRHLGVDFVLITQGPMLLDSFVRSLVDRHFHIVRKFGTHWATIHEYVNGVRDNVLKSRGDSIRHEWRYPKEVFDWYRSAELHTVKRRIPLRVWILLSLVIVLPVLVGVAYHYVKPETVAAQTQKNLQQADGNSYSGGQQGGRSGGSARSVEVMTPLQYAQAYTPRVQGLPHTAPVYDEVTRPTEAPYPAACVSMPAKHRCSCYTQQGTRLDTGKDLCEQIAAGGFFVAWRQQVAQAVPIAAPGADPAPARPTAAAGIGMPEAQQVAVMAEPVEQDSARPRVRR